MFNKTRSRIEHIKAAFRLFIATVETLTRALEINRATIAANTAEQTLLREKLAAIGEHTKYLADAKRAELTRSGHHRAA